MINLKLSAIDVDRRQLFIKNAKGRKDRVLEMLKSQFVTERNIKPSENDKRLTRKIKEGAKLLDITLLDHVIVTKDTYYSFVDDGNL